MAARLNYRELLATTMQKEVKMVSYHLIINEDNSTLKIGPFSADIWPLEGEILKMDLTLERHGQHRLAGPRYDVLSCDRDEGQVTVTRHIGP